jgi:hypothetical protein
VVKKERVFNENFAQEINRPDYSTQPVNNFHIEEWEYTVVF